MENRIIRVGLLAYGAIGHEHNQAVQNTAGLELLAVCDTNPERVEAALELAPDATAFSDAATQRQCWILDFSTLLLSPPHPIATISGPKNRSCEAFM